MNRRTLLLAAVTATCVLGCAGATKNTTGFAVKESITVDGEFADVWQATKAVLREQKLDIYTRDKRGAFVAYTPMKRRLYVLTPRRTQLRVTIERVTAETTRVNVEAVDQVYGVTLLTYPDWHDRKTADSAVATRILDALQAKLS